MKLARAPLEDWLRDYYFTADVDISSSGVDAYGFAELRKLLGITAADLDAVVFRDSPSCGVMRLRETLARRWGDGDPARIMATNGSSEALFLVMTTVLSAGDKVVVVDPAYHSLVSIAEGVGCRIVRWRLDFDRGFAPDLDELPTLLDADTRMVVVNFPHNPTGVTVDGEIQRRIVDIVADRGCYLVWDAAFAELVHDRPPLPDVSRLYSRAITFGTLSKAYGLPGLRVGWCIAPPGVLDGCVALRDYTTLALSPLVELVAIRAIEQADVLLKPMLTQARANLTILEQWIGDHADRVQWIRPGGGVTAFPYLRGIGDDVEFCHRLMREKGTLLVPGSIFGRPGHVRLGFGGATPELERGLSALSQALQA